MRTRLLFIGISLLTGLSGCEKRLVDYRNKYTGGYRLTVTYSYWKMGQGVYDSGTFEYNGRIWYDKKNDERDIIHLQFSDQIEIPVRIDKEGVLYAPCNSTPGNADRKKFELSYSTACAGGAMGGYKKYTISGVKN